MVFGWQSWLFIDEHKRKLGPSDDGLCLLKNCHEEMPPRHAFLWRLSLLKLSGFDFLPVSFSGSHLALLCWIQHISYRPTSPTPTSGKYFYNHCVSRYFSDNNNTFEDKCIWIYLLPNMRIWCRFHSTSAKPNPSKIESVWYTSTKVFTHNACTVREAPHAQNNTYLHSPPLESLLLK